MLKCELKNIPWCKKNKSTLLRYKLYRRYGFLVFKETVVLRRWERSKQKFVFIRRVDKGWITTVKGLESRRFERLPSERRRSLRSDAGNGNDNATNQSMIWLVEQGKIVMLHVQHAFGCIFFGLVCQRTTRNFHFWSSDDNASPQQWIFHCLTLH